MLALAVDRLLSANDDDDDVGDYEDDFHHHSSRVIPLCFARHTCLLMVALCCLIKYRTYLVIMCLIKNDNKVVQANGPGWSETKLTQQTTYFKPHSVT
jgi:hypothetical protein